MCGIAGFISKSRHDARDIVEAMTRTIAYRGPDDSGAWIDSETGVVLGHRRLAIVDLSPSGHQPMHSASGRYVLVYNGEIYNYAALRQELETLGQAPEWRGHSDTEVLLAAFEYWGIAATLERANGMFAFALWDKRARTLTLARDRIGEKPLYYGLHGQTLLFASELKAITSHPDFRGEINREALAGFMRLGYVPGTTSIWRGIYKLPPAHMMTVALDDLSNLIPHRYWDAARTAHDGTAAPVANTPELIEELERLLGDAVRMRMVADVPLGAFLSGGIDSSLVTALMQVQSSKPVRTFSIGFKDPSYDEAPHARAIARHLGTDHTELYVDMDQARDLLPSLPDIWDEPLADSSQIPTYLVSRMASKHVKVALSGDGGDELFGGYNRHVTGARIWDNARAVPMPLRNLASLALTHKATGVIAEKMVRLLPARHRHAGVGARLPKIGAVIGARSEMDFYKRLISQWQEENIVLNVTDDSPPLLAPPAFEDFRNTMMFLDMTTYLPDDILVKLDRASMASSIEGRVPLLDHRVVEFAWRIPLEAKIREGKGKRILRDVLYRHVPRAMIERPKSGFAIPIGKWLTGPLRDWAEDLINERRLKAEGYLDPAIARHTWERFSAGEASLDTRIWCILMFQAWLTRQSASVAHAIAA